MQKFVEFREQAVPFTGVQPAEVLLDVFFDGVSIGTVTGDCLIAEVCDAFDRAGLRPGFVFHFSEALGSSLFILELLVKVCVVRAAPKLSQIAGV